eukprot:scaffold995_cov244-Pinguiococcus_pyrenoidosus.AAC.14
MSRGLASWSRRSWRKLGSLVLHHTSDPSRALSAATLPTDTPARPLHGQLRHLLARYDRGGQACSTSGAARPEQHVRSAWASGRNIPTAASTRMLTS